jgi:hypothetical protein
VKFSNHIGGYNAFLVFTPRICQRKKLAYIYFTLLDKCISCEFQDINCLFFLEEVFFFFLVTNCFIETKPEQQTDQTKKPH